MLIHAHAARRVKLNLIVQMLENIINSALTKMTILGLSVVHHKMNVDLLFYFETTANFYLIVSTYIIRVFQICED